MPSKVSVTPRWNPLHKGAWSEDTWNFVKTSRNEKELVVLGYSTCFRNCPLWPSSTPPAKKKKKIQTLLSYKGGLFNLQSYFTYQLLNKDPSQIEREMYENFPMFWGFDYLHRYEKIEFHVEFFFPYFASHKYLLIPI